MVLLVRDTSSRKWVRRGCQVNRHRRRRIIGNREQGTRQNSELRAQGTENAKREHRTKANDRRGGEYCCFGLRLPVGSDRARAGFKLRRQEDGGGQRSGSAGARESESHAAAERTGAARCAIPRRVWKDRAAGRVFRQE